MIDPASTRILVVGAGIGGLTSAIALNRAGFSAVDVVERAQTLREVGAALTLWSNALKALAFLGLDGAVRAAGSEVEIGRLLSPSGRVLVETRVGDVGRALGAPSVCLHRADLQRILAAALGPVPLRLGEECVRVRDDGVRPVTQFASGQEIPADVIVGADGLRSAARAEILGDAPPRYSGYTCWRAVAAAPLDALPAGHAFETWGRGARFGAIRIDAARAYWFASENAPPGGRDAACRPRLLDRFGRWHAPIAELVEATPEDAIQRLDILDRPPVRRTGRGRVTLLGDAAHPSTPNLGQGACLAIEDAVVLASRLRAESSVEAALREYESRRRPRTAAIVRRSRRLGAIGQIESPVLRGLRDAAMRLAPRGLMLRAFAVNLAFACELE